MFKQRAMKGIKTRESNIAKAKDFVTNDVVTRAVVLILLLSASVVRTHMNTYVYTMGVWISPDILSIDGNNGVAIHVTVARVSGENKFLMLNWRSFVSFLKTKTCWVVLLVEHCLKEMGDTTVGRVRSFPALSMENILAVLARKKTRWHLPPLRFLACVCGPIEKCYFLIYATVPGSLTCLASTMLEPL